MDPAVVGEGACKGQPDASGHGQDGEGKLECVHEHTPCGQNLI